MAEAAAHDNPEPGISRPSEHVRLLHPEDRRGVATLARRDPHERRWREQPIAIQSLPAAANAVAGRHDVYLSQQRFHGWRCIAQLRELSACYVDLDYRNSPWAGSSAERVAYAVLRALDETGTPDPWLIATGRGLLALWPHDPVRRHALPRWQAVQRHLAARLEPFGADKRALDAARVFRLLGTKNSNADGELVRLIHAPTTERWAFDDLAEEVLPVARGELRSLRSERARRRAAGQVSGHPQRHLTAATLWESRLSDLQRLRWHRFMGELPSGQRDTWLFLAATATSWLSPPAVLRREVFALAQEVGGWAEAEAKQRFAAVLNRAHAAAQGETVTWRGYDVDPRYRFTTQTIIDWLEITDDEMRAADLRALISESVEHERQRERMREHRGSTDRETYRQAVHTGSLAQLRPWERLGMSRATWYRHGKPSP